MAEIDYKKLSEDKFNEWTDLWDRMQEDADLVNMKEQYPITSGTYRKLQDSDGHEIINSIGILLNDAANFAWRVETALNKAVEQIIVTAESKRFDTVYIENFIRRVFKEADKKLPLRDLYPLNPFLDQQTCRRGRVASRVLMQVEKGILNCDITPWDTRYFVYGMDKDGLAYATYKTSRTKDQILSEYPDVNMVETRSEVEVMDIWTREKNEIWVGNEKVLEQKHHLGYVPVVFRKVPIGSMLMDTDTIKYQGDSIFFLIRDLLPELNRLVSIIQSINIKELDRALQLKKPLDTIKSKDPLLTVDEVTAAGTVTVVPTGGGFDLMPLGQIREQAQILHNMIQGRVDEAMGRRFQDVMQPKTATEILEIGQEQETIILPRLGTRGLLKQGLAEMFIKQVIESGASTIKVGNNTFDVPKLKGEYEIEFSYYFKDPKRDIARASMAASMRGLLSDTQLRRDVLQVEDPEETERLLRWEEAERISPLVKIDRTIRALLEEADRGNEAARIESEILCDSQMCPMLEQAIMGAQLKSSEEVKPSQPLVPITSGVT